MAASWSTVCVGPSLRTIAGRKSTRSSLPGHHDGWLFAVVIDTSLAKCRTLFVDSHLGKPHLARLFRVFRGVLPISDLGNPAANHSEGGLCGKRRMQHLPKGRKPIWCLGCLATRTPWTRTWTDISATAIGTVPGLSPSLAEFSWRWNGARKAETDGNRDGERWSWSNSSGLSFFSYCFAEFEMTNPTTATRHTDRI